MESNFRNMSKVAELPNTLSPQCLLLTQAISSKTGEGLENIEIWRSRILMFLEQLSQCRMNVVNTAAPLVKLWRDAKDKIKW